MKNLTWQNPEQLFVAQELINKVKSKCCGIKGINSIRSASNHPLNNYWGYIDMALDNFHTKEGQSMRTYLCQKEPGIKLDNKEETIVKETNLYKALTILYPDIYN